MQVEMSLQYVIVFMKWSTKSIMHVHLALIWTIVLGIIGSILGGTVTHMFSRPREGVKFHPAGLIFSVLGSVLVLFLCHKLKIRFPN